MLPLTKVARFWGYDFQFSDLEGWGRGGGRAVGIRVAVLGRGLGGKGGGRSGGSGQGWWSGWRLREGSWCCGFGGCDFQGGGPQAGNRNSGLASPATERRVPETAWDSRRETQITGAGEPIGMML